MHIGEQNINPDELYGNEDWYIEMKKDKKN